MRRLLPVLALCAAAPALAAPRIGVVTLAHEGLTEEDADGVAYDLAAAAATQFDGEAIAGSSVRDRLPPGEPSDDCDESAECPRKLAAALQVDEVLLLSMHLAGKTIVVACKRVARDPARPAAERTLRLFGGKAKRAQAVLDLAATLYPSGSVTPFVAPPLPPPPSTRNRTPTAKHAAREPARTDDARLEVHAAPEPDGNRRRWLMWGLIGGGAVVAVLAVILGVALGTTASPTAPSVMLP